MTRESETKRYNKEFIKELLVFIVVTILIVSTIYIILSWGLQDYYNLFDIALTPVRK